MSAERLRRVAADMRAKAEAATEGNWFQESPPRNALVRTDGLAADLDDEIATTITSDDAAHIAAWHPAVALAVADWLEHEAAGVAAGLGLSGHHIAVCDAWEATS